MTTSQAVVPSLTKTLEDLLTSLATGEESSKLISFPSPEERERFRQAIYKTKKNFDEILLMTDRSYEISSLRFNKRDTPEGWFVELSLGKPIRAPITFSIIQSCDSPFKKNSP